MPIIQVIFEIIKNILLKFLLTDVIKKVISWKLIKDTLFVLTCICSFVVFWYLFKLQEYTKTGSEHLRYSNFISSKMKPKIDTTVDELFKDSKENSYFFISLIEVDFSKSYCEFRWKYIKGFNEGTKKSFEEIKKKNPNYRDDTPLLCDSYDTKEKIIELSNSRINVDLENGNKNLLFTQKKWLDDEKTNYKVAYLTYFIKPYESKSEFYIIQVASLKPLKKIIQKNRFDYQFQSLVNELNKITQSPKPYDFFNK